MEMLYLQLKYTYNPPLDSSSSIQTAFKQLPRMQPDDRFVLMLLLLLGR